MKFVLNGDTQELMNGKSPSGNLNKAFRMLRKSRGLTQTKAGQILGLSVTSITNIETQTQSMYFSRFETLANHLGYDVEVTLRHRENKLLLDKTMDIPASVLEQLEKMLYQNPVIIGDKLCGTFQYVFTTGLVVGINSIGYERRYCYENIEDAVKALSDWDGVEHPNGPWIKCKGSYLGESIDLLNPNLESIEALTSSAP